MQNRARNSRSIVGLDGQPLILSGAYEGASTGSRLGEFGGSDISATGADNSELAILKRRSRQMVRNTPWASRAITANVANEIGAGIVPKPNTPNDEFNKQLKELWQDYKPYADASGLLCAYGLQSLAVRSRLESGEVFIRIRPRKLSDGLPVPVQFQIIEADFCPTTLNETRANGNQIKSGIEFNKIGKIVAYWMYKDHPADGSGFLDLIRIPAKQIIHHFIPLRAGQIRGVPTGVQAFVRSYTYDQYDDAELVRKKSRSQYAGVIELPELQQDLIDDNWKFNPLTGKKFGEDLGALNIAPGQFPVLDDGESLKLFDGDSGGGNDKDFAKRQLLAIAASFNIPYQLMTGDYAGVSDRVWRAVINQYHRELEQIQDLYTIHQLTRRMHHVFVDYAVIAGAVDVPADYVNKPFAYKRAMYQPQAWPYIHPKQDVETMMLLQKAGFDSRQNIMARRGRDAQEIDRQRKEDMDREQALGLNPDKKTKKPPTKNR